MTHGERGTLEDGFRLRRYRGPDDIPLLVPMINASRAFDGRDAVETVDSISAMLAAATTWEPSRDFVIAELDGRVVGGGALDPFVTDGTWNGYHFGWVEPAARRRGIGRAILRELQASLRTLARQTTAPKRTFCSMIGEAQAAAERMLVDDGYTLSHVEAGMVRSLAEPIALLPLPSGLEVRRPRPGEYPAVWGAMVEAFRDTWPPIDWTEEDYRAWLVDPVRFAPDVWQVVWDGDEVVGSSLGWIDAAENATHGRARGHCERISVRPAYRGHGIASAIITRVLADFRARGLAEATLRADTANPTGALELYRRLGFRVEDSSSFYERPVEA